MIAIDDTLSEYATLLGEQAGDSLDQLIRDVVAAGAGTTRWANGAASRAAILATDIFDNAEIVRAVATLHDEKARPFEDGLFVGIISPNTWYDLMLDPNIVN